MGMLYRKIPQWFLVFPMTAAALGTWQVYRWRRKLRMIEARQSMWEEEPLEVQDSQALEDVQARLLNGATDVEHRRLKLHGRFGHRQLLLGPRVDGREHGYLVFSRFHVDGGASVLVNRGWVSKDQAHIDLGGDFDDKSPREICGVLRTSETRSSYLPDNDPTRNLWIWRDIPRMADSLNASLRTVAVDQVACDDEPAAPLSKPPRHDFAAPVPRLPSGPPASLPNNHVIYLITWYTLAFFTTLIYRKAR